MKPGLATTPLSEGAAKEKPIVIRDFSEALRPWQFTPVEPRKKDENFEHRDPQTFHLFFSACLDARFGGAKLEQADGASSVLVTSTSPVGRIRHSVAKARVKVDGAWMKATERLLGGFPSPKS